jgi:hypothetical protein
MSPEATERSFDELAVGLSSGKLSRGKAIKLMGASLVGGVLASIPGIAEAAPKPFTKPPGRKCSSNEQCETGRCLSSGVCSGIPRSSKASRSCPAGCEPVILEDGSIGCFSCPSGSCGIQTSTSCADCAALGSNLQCVPYGSPGSILAYACLPPCTAG